MKSQFKIIGLFLALLLTSSSLFAAVKVTASVSNNSVIKGDLFILTVDINDKDSDYRLDTSPLEEAFVVYRPSQSQSTELINGSLSQKTQWRVRLQAKEAGTFIIPALTIGTLSTQPIEIKVSELAQATKNTGQADDLIFLENSLNKQDVYIGQSFIFTTKLYLAQNTNDLSLDDPHFEGAEVAVFEKDKSEQSVNNGIRYTIITRQYKMTATQAGQFEIDSPLLKGTMRKVVAVNQWQNRAISEAINVRGERLTIKVNAIPDNYQGEWLVSEDLALIENNDLTAQQYKVGDPITRSITLQIASVDLEKLPNIKLNYPSSLRFYPDQDQLQEGKANGLTYGVRTISHAIIADKEGTLTLPEITLNWFNSTTNKAEVARLPAQTITILPAEEQAFNVTPVVQSNLAPVEQVIMVDHQTLLYWQMTVALLIIVILVMVFYHLSYRRLQTNKNQPQKSQPVMNEHYLLLQESFRNHDAPKCYSLLLKYAQQQFVNIKGLAELPNRCALCKEKSILLQHEIQWLQICCSDKSQHWNANKLAALIAEHESQKSNKESQNTMQLNP